MAKGVKILRALDPFTFKTLQRGNPVPGALGQRTSGDAQVEQELALGRLRVAAKAAYEKFPWNSGSKVPFS
jgi:hypothetical protein